MTQLDLFSWESEQTGRGLQKLLDLEFDEAQQIFKDLLESFPGKPEALKGSITALYWGKVFEQCGNFATADEVEYLHLEIKDFDYSKSVAPGLFKNALLNKLTVLMQDKNLFYINGKENLCDILIHLKEYENALGSVAMQLKKEPDDSLLYLQKANVLWLLGYREKAGENYTIGILCRLDEEFQYPLENEELAKMLNERSNPCLALCSCYMRGNFDLYDLRNSGRKPSCKEAVADDWQAYHTLFDAEKARKSHGQNPLKHRKKLKKMNPTLYKDYFEWLGHIQRPL